MFISLYGNKLESQSVLTNMFKLFSVNSDAAFTVEIKHDDKITDEEGVFVQVMVDKRYTDRLTIKCTLRLYCLFSVFIAFWNAKLIIFGIYFFAFWLYCCQYGWCLTSIIQSGVDTADDLIWHSPRNIGWGRDLWWRIG